MNSRIAPRMAKAVSSFRTLSNPLERRGKMRIEEGPCLRIQLQLSVLVCWFYPHFSPWNVVIARLSSSLLGSLISLISQCVLESLTDERHGKMKRRSHSSWSLIPRQTQHLFTNASNDSARAHRRVYCSRSFSYFSQIAFLVLEESQYKMGSRSSYCCLFHRTCTLVQVIITFTTHSYSELLFVFVSSRLIHYDNATSSNNQSTIESPNVPIALYARAALTFFIPGIQRAHHLPSHRKNPFSGRITLCFAPSLSRN